MPFNTWTDPSIFAETQNVNSVVLNKYVSENMRYLLNRPRDITTLVDIGDFTTTSTSFVAVSTTSLRLSLTLQQQGDVRLWLNGSYSVNNTNNRVVSTDILMDGATYASSNDATANTLGLSTITNNTLSNVKKGIVFDFVWKDIPEGVHYFDLCWKIDANTLTLYTNPTLQFGGMEV